MVATELGAQRIGVVLFAHQVNHHVHDVFSTRSESMTIGHKNGATVDFQMTVKESGATKRWDCQVRCNTDRGI